MKNNLFRLSNDKGVTAVVVALLLTVFLGIAALAVDVGYVYMAKNQLQNAADAAALAGARKLGAICKGLSIADQNPLSDVNIDLVKDVATATAAANKAAMISVTINDSDIKIGKWNFSDKSLNETNIFPRAVRVTANREGASGIGTFFARIFGTKMVSVSATATATLTPSTEGEGRPPIGIENDWFLKTQCGQVIQFNPTTTSCAGWTTFSYNANTPNLKGLIDGTLDTPTVHKGDSINFTGGDLAAAFDNFVALFDKMKSDEDNDPTTPPTWTTKVVVYDDGDTSDDDPDNIECSNPNQSKIVVGFATTTIYEVIPAPDKIIRAKLECGHIDDGPGGGIFDTGTYGEIPQLVE